MLNKVKYISVNFMYELFIQHNITFLASICLDFDSFILISNYFTLQLRIKKTNQNSAQKSVNEFW